jgi:hypothetical protein
MKFINDKSPMPSGVHSTVILPDQVEHDIAGQTMTNTLTRNTMDNIYMGSSITLPSNHEKQNQRRSRPKVRNAVILLIFGFVGIVIGAILRAFLSSQSQSQGSSKRSSTDTKKTSTDDLPVVPPSDTDPVVNQLDNYKLQVCNSTNDGNAKTELCTAVDCFSGPHCSCQVYLREEGSTSIIGICNSCRVCDLNSNFAFDCSNIGLSAVKGALLCLSVEMTKMEKCWIHHLEQALAKILVSTLHLIATLIGFASLRRI